jgi:multisubunit Na+/H+ antiporter MnhC subunit
MIAWLDDLKTVLPTHSSQGVADSLRRWTLWAQTVDLTTLDLHDVNDTIGALHRCGQQWRAILSGEKRAQDLLTTTDYVSATRSTLVHVGAIVRALARQLWVPLAVAALLIGVGIWLIVANRGTAQVLAGLGTIAGGLGITWRSAAGAGGHLSLDLVRPLWAAQLDIAVATCLTPLPQRDYVHDLERPRSRVRRAWRELRTADPAAPRGLPAKRDPN